jgi:hypothetical protein
MSTQLDSSTNIFFANVTFGCAVWYAIHKWIGVTTVLPMDLSRISRLGGSKEKEDLSRISRLGGSKEKEGLLLIWHSTTIWSIGGKKWEKNKKYKMLLE